MRETSVSKRTDTASAVIRSAPQIIYRAFLDPEAVALWRPPKGMKSHIYEFNPQVGGTFRMSFDYTDAHHEVPGKTSEHADIFHGRFIELVPDKRIVELVEFESGDPAFAGEMTITTTLVPVSGGTEVIFVAKNVPAGIRPDDHHKGMLSTLENLAEFTKKPNA
jgi:uncharacterized protein YndB with AHSA1/START domain